MAYLTLADLKTYLDVTNTGDDTLLTGFITEATTIFESETGDRVFEASADGIRYFEVGVNTSGRELYFDTDCCAITTVRNNADNGSSGVIVTSTQYVTLPRNTTPYHGIRLLSSAGISWQYTSDPEAGISVAGKWAYSITPPNDVKYAVKRLAAFMYRNKDAQVFETVAMPDAGMITVPKGTPQDIVKTIAHYKRVV